MSMRTMWCVAAAMLLTAALHVNLSAQKGYDTFNKALAAEKADGDLRGAIRLYEQVVREAGKDRQLAARALLRIGDAYRRLGDGQARAAFARVLKEYTDVPDVADVARARLEVTPDGSGAVRLVAAMGGAINFDGLITADGRLPGTNWSNGDVVFLDTVTGSVSRVASGGFGTPANGWGEIPVLSPDRKQVAYLWFEEGSRGTLHQLRITSTDRGAKPRVLVNDLDRVHEINPVAWSSDTRRVLVAYRIPIPEGVSLPGRDLQLAWIAVADGTIAPIKRLEWWRTTGNSLGLITLSPDGRYLAYAAAPSQGSNDRSIYVMAVDGSATSEVAGGGVNESPVWAPDGRRVLFVSDRAGSFGIYSVPVQNGKPSGLIVPVKPNTGRVDLHGFMGAGRLYYSAYSRIEETFIAPVERDGRMLPNVAAIDSTPGNNVAWSPDGTLLAMKRRHPDGRFEVVVRHMQTRKETKWSGNNADGRPLGNLPVFWIGNTRLMVDRQTPLELVGDELRRAGAVAVPRGSLARDGSAIYALAGGQEARINLVDPLTGQQKSSFPLPEAAAAVALNPSGDTLALLNPRRLAIVRSDGTDYREVYVPGAGSRLSGSVRWAGDGRTLLCTVEGPKETRLMRVPITGGQPEPAGLAPDSAVRFDVSPDGSRIAYTNPRESVEVWSLELDRLVQK